jgi:hypothetical protein
MFADFSFQPCRAVRMMRNRSFDPSHRWSFFRSLTDALTATSYRASQSRVEWSAEWLPPDQPIPSYRETYIQFKKPHTSEVPLYSSLRISHLELFRFMIPWTLESFLHLQTDCKASQLLLTAENARVRDERARHAPSPQHDPDSRF